MQGLSVKNELFAVRLLELLRILEPEGNRVHFVGVCERHGVRSFLERFPETWKRIIDDPPRPGLTSSQQFKIGRTAFALQIAAFQDSLLKALREHGYQALSIKGPSLSKLLYGDISERDFGDLDLLVDPAHIASVANCLDQMDFRRTYPPKMKPGQERGFYRYCKAQNFLCPKTRRSLDLHWKLLSPWIGADLMPFQEVWARSQVLRRPGLSPWRTLGNDDTVVFLALHGYQDGWQRMKQLLELAVALEVLPFCWQEVLSVAGPRRILVERAVELCVRLLGVPHPKNMTYHYRDYDHALDDWLEMARASRSPQRDLLAPHLWSCSATKAWVWRLRALLNPAIDDIKSIELPPSLVFLYPLVRAGRLGQKWLHRR